MLEDASQCRTEILFEWLLIHHWIHRLIFYLDRHPHFCGAIEVDELTVKVLATVKPGSKERLIEVRLSVGKRQVLDLTEERDRSADGLTRLPLGTMIGELWWMTMGENNRHDMLY